MTAKYHSFKRFTLFATISLALSWPAWAGSDEAMNLLNKMSKAADELDYSGEFVYVKDGQISSMKIVHIGAIEGGAGSQQKLMALDGSMREIIQQEDLVACVLPDQGMGLREKRQSRSLFKINASGKIESITQHYTLNMKQPARIANRDCEQVTVLPNDDYRYGYNLCIDSKNQLLLSSELSDSDGKVLESYQFVGVNFDKVDITEIRSETPPKTLSWMDDKPKTTTIKMNASEAGQKWRVTDNQTGFQLEHYIERISPLMQADITHLVLGDGLAQVSVFITSADASANQPNTSLNMGGLNSFTRKINGYMVTVIGEVPAATVTLIAEHTEAY